MSDPLLRREIARRRTFAIISHPDAGKTTLTEKLLLYGGAIRQAGLVRARRAQRQATSDWLALERERGISVSSSVMTFEFDDYRVNILDTPGHHDFSEDTYRTLTAADSAVMLIDAAKGVEAQTRKLFTVCRQRGIPIFTFINKMDRHGRDPLELMGELEDVLGLHATPVNWPVGAGSDFRGVYDRIGQRLLLFHGGDHGAKQVDQEVIEGALDSPQVVAALGDRRAEVCDSLELLEGAGEAFDVDKVRRGELTPLYFGSALTNFGILPFLESFLELAPPPAPRQSSDGEVKPERPFSGFVFKIQANMDPGHRDRVAFVRVCSGKFVKGATTVHVRTGKPFRLANSSMLMAQDRQEIEEAFPGDVVGLFDPGVFRMGDTLCDEGTFEFADMPRFSPEHFRRVRFDAGSNRKALAKGLEQLTQEGLVQLFREPHAATAEPILGAVGPLQFDVLQYRMQSEYRVDLTLTSLAYKAARWPKVKVDPESLRYSLTTKVVEDREGRSVLLFDTQWSLQQAREKWPEWELEP